jgi:hypothetical protein
MGPVRSDQSLPTVVGSYFDCRLVTGGALCHAIDRCAARHCLDRIAGRVGVIHCRYADAGALHPTKPSIGWRRNGRRVECVRRHVLSDSRFVGGAQARFAGELWYLFDGDGCGHARLGSVARPQTGTGRRGRCRDSTDGAVRFGHCVGVRHLFGGDVGIGSVGQTVGRNGRHLHAGGGVGYRRCGCHRDLARQHARFGRAV